MDSHAQKATWESNSSWKLEYFLSLTALYFLFDSHSSGTRTLPPKQWGIGVVLQRSLNCWCYLGGDPEEKNWEGRSRSAAREAALCKIKERIKKTKDEKKAKKVDFFHQARICSLWFTFQVDCFHALRMSDLLFVPIAVFFKQGLSSSVFNNNLYILSACLFLPILTAWLHNCHTDFIPASFLKLNSFVVHSLAHKFLMSWLVL